MIAAHGLTKRFGTAVAVENVSFAVKAGELVGLVGHDGAGKTTTLRMLVGHVTPTAGSAEILGRPFAELAQPLRDVGVLLDRGVHPGRRLRDHLRICAARGDLDEAAIADVLRTVGLEHAADLRGRDVPVTMYGRIGLAAALLGEPQVLILDEPGAGLDSNGMRWLRTLLCHLAHDGCAVLFTCGEADALAAVADRLLVLDRGSLLAESAPDELTEAEAEVLVRTPGAEVLADELRDAGVAPSTVSVDEVRVRDAPVPVVSRIANASGVPVWEIREDAPSLQETVADMTQATSSNGCSPAEADGGDDDAGEPSGPDDDAEAVLDAELGRLARLERCNVVALVAPAGGLGRTTLAFLVADVLAAAAGMSTLAVALSCDHERMSLPAASDNRTSLTLDDLLGDLPDFDEMALISPYVSVAHSGAHALSGPSQAAALAALEPAQIEALLDLLARFYGLVVLDVGDLPAASLRAVVRRADRVLLLGAPGAVDDLGRSDVLDAIEAAHSDRAVLAFNRVDQERLRTYSAGAGPGSHVLIPRDRELIRALDAGDFELGSVEPVTRYALKRLGLAVAEGLR